MRNPLRDSIIEKRNGIIDFAMKIDNASRPNFDHKIIYRVLEREQGIAWGETTRVEDYNFLKEFIDSNQGVRTEAIMAFRL